ncbi:hypothetical protein DY000_02031932 [Brassica cretica]|uniref:DUF1985 domain-containing protein n=1 Tax=Brassica cretica TaxID=69181 RepID=A0ABQ7E044_BRACR|nr:hypothetical protein DY000_02031932 [Brassica cretica]
MRKPKTKKKVKIFDEETPPQNEIGGTSLPDLRLPPRIFATDRFPTKRLNIYSSPDLLPFIRNVLRDTPELETIRQSAFGGSPFRYGLEEFGIVTGLPCGFFPERYKPNTGKAIVAGKDRVWKRLFGKIYIYMTFADLCRMLETDKDMDGWKMIWISLIIIVDGVLIAHKQEARPTPRYVRMVENLKKKFAFLWGRESFLKTISCMKPPKFVRKKCEDPVATLVKKLKQHNGNLPQHNSINSINICRVKFDPNLVVTPIIPIESQAQPGWELWPDDVKDNKPLIKKPKNRVKKKAASIKQSLKSRQPFRRKQRRISSYVTRSSRPQLHQRSTYGDGDPSFNAGEAAPPRDETMIVQWRQMSCLKRDRLSSVNMKLNYIVILQLIILLAPLFHTTPHSFEFSNKFLLELAKPKQWTTTRTKENLCRRFYRCEIGVKRQSEHHLFKWIDEEIIDDISKVDSKLSQLRADVQSFKRTMTQRLQEHGKNIDESLLEMKRIIHDQTIMLAELRNNSTLVVDASYASLTNGSFVTKSTSPLLNIAVAAIALGTMAWLYEKIST